MERILLQESQPYDFCNLKYQFLVIRKNVPSDQLYNLHQAALLI